MPSTVITYDLDGNTLNDGTNTYTWDARNRLVSADSGAATFSYDALGRRIGKTIASANTNFLYDGVNPVQELNGTTPTANLLTGGIDERFTRTDANGTLNYITDALGSTIALTDTSGNSNLQYSYDPYGGMNATGSTTNSYTYTGREFDGLGLYYYRARYYNPNTGRFLSEDPIGFDGGINKYAYAGNDPIDYFDPFGLDKNSPNSSCSAATAFLSNLGNQLSADGDILTWSGIGIIGISGIGALLAPEAFPLEAGGFEAGSSLIALGSGVSKLGAIVQGYATDGAVGAATSGYISFLEDGVSEDLTNWFSQE
jgi:RHS repeat-associated protein